MIYIVEKPNAYIAAVLSTTVVLAKFLTSVPEELANELIATRKNEVFPLRLLGQSALTLYTIKEEFLGDPKTPGEDYMSRLDHQHLQEGEK